MPSTSSLPHFKISVVIATKDRYHDLLNCLQSLNAQTYLPSEIIIVDSSADEKIKKELEKKNDYKMPVKYIHSQPGLTLQRNIGIKLASGDLLAFLDDDIVLHPDFFEKSAPSFLNKKMGGVTGRIINEISSRWSLANVFRFLTFFSYQSYGQIRISGFHTEYNWCEKPLKVAWLPGVCIYLREVFNKFSFDENLSGYAYNEDLDLSYRISREYECWYIPDAKCIHNKSASRLSPNIARDVIVNNHYLLYKNILPGKRLSMKFLHVMTFYIAIFSFLFFLFITCKFRILKGGIKGLIDIWFKKTNFKK